MPDGRAIKLLVPEAYPKRPARAVTDQTVRFISELDRATLKDQVPMRIRVANRNPHLVRRIPVD